jgi:hypothetical protein
LRSVQRQWYTREAVGWYAGKKRVTGGREKEKGYGGPRWSGLAAEGTTTRMIFLSAKKGVSE